MVQYILEKCKKHNAQLCIATKTRTSKEIDTVNIDDSIILAENRIQEAEEKKEYFASVSNPKHFIGTLQKNKVRKAIRLFDVIQTVDSLELLERINNIAKEEGKKQEVFLYINISEDEKKGGIVPNHVTNIIDDILNNDYQSILITGLFTILKNNLEPDEIKEHYKKMKILQIDIQQKIPTLDQLSMGMSNDYQIALEEGATIVRVGRRVFGERCA